MFLQPYNCVLCIELQEEDRFHLFFNCPFSQACWIFLGINWDTSLDYGQMILKARQEFGKVFFREIVIIACWAIWCYRNNIIFDRASLSFAAWRGLFEKDMKLVTLRVKPSLKDKILLWLSSL
ncbi:hypothetical protein SETIT_8G077800v2 [Setaria italica]|uniref:Reverse transcriptase zinc-binding domain-containing protein n=2 Tax=Setaria TaxID=4554 RepID=A0A368S5J7_SETIT|nr:hypothetical protein SETIT_8G077800v2 [Setaria italica]TKV99974.1 hypothetical protein SEVIR_8G079200v2 [Setaria viridis]